MIDTFLMLTATLKKLGMVTTPEMGDMDRALYDFMTSAINRLDE